MTVVAAHRSGFMVADTITVSDMWKLPCESNKILNLSHSLVGCAGRASFKQILEPILRKATSPEAVIEIIAENMRETRNEDSMALVCNVKGEIVRIADGNVSYIDSSLNYYAIGSGGDLLTGWLDAAEFYQHELTPEVFAEGIKHAERHTWTISSTVSAEGLDPNWKPKKAVKRKSKAAKKASKRK